MPDSARLPADVAMLLLQGWRWRGLGRALLDAFCTRAGFVEEGRKLRHYRRRSGELWGSVLMGLPLDPAP